MLLINWVVENRHLHRRNLTNGTFAANVRNRQTAISKQSKKPMSTVQKCVAVFECNIWQYPTDFSFLSAVLFSSFTECKLMQKWHKTPSYWYWYWAQPYILRSDIDGKLSIMKWIQLYAITKSVTKGRTVPVSCNKWVFKAKVEIQKTYSELRFTLFLSRTQPIHTKNCEDLKLISLLTLTLDDITTLLHGHNGLRNRIAMTKDNPVSNMNLLYWDRNLQRMAEGWIKQCIIDTDSCDFMCTYWVIIYFVQKKIPFSGALLSFLVSNIIFFVISKSKMKTRLRLAKIFVTSFLKNGRPVGLIKSLLNGFWKKMMAHTLTGNNAQYVFKKKTIFGWIWIINFRRRTNRTQIIWAETEFIGCAAAQLRAEATLILNNNTDLINANKNLHHRYVHGYMLACNYNPAANLPGHSMFKPGQPCTNCSDDRPGCSYIYQGLCGIGLITFSRIRVHIAHSLPFISDIPTSGSERLHLNAIIVIISIVIVYPINIFA